jgi:hypothetical protein
VVFSGDVGLRPPPVYGRTELQPLSGREERRVGEVGRWLFVGR